MCDIANDDQIKIEDFMEYNDFRKFTYATTFDSAFKRAEIALQNKDFEGAILDFSQALEYQPNSIEANVHKALCLIALKRYVSAIPIAEKLIKLEPESSTHYATLATCYFEMQKYVEADNYFSKAIEIKPNDYPLYVYRGESRFKAKNYSAAFFDFTKCIEMQPTILGAYDFRGRTRGVLKDYKGAIADFLHILNHKPDSGEILFQLGVSYLHDNQIELGEKALKKAAKLGLQKATDILNSKS